MKNVVVWKRVSTEDQSGLHQVLAIQKVAEAQDWCIRAEYGTTVSGKTEPSDVETWNQLLSDLKTGIQVPVGYIDEHGYAVPVTNAGVQATQNIKIDAVVVTAIDRFPGMRRAGCVESVRRVLEQGVEVISLAESWISSTEDPAMRMFLVNILNYLATSEAAQISRRTKQAHQSGLHPGWGKRGKDKNRRKPRSDKGLKRGRVVLGWTKKSSETPDKNGGL